ncbi:MAG: EAL domain-containing protein [Lachnospiraceae bacterium]|uniref:EAL domain-containing protein n=1 Tax=Candidatus Weimeria bifida TaxID=2599074 RepID=A0A6N7IXC0_9FIRM|nr:EAL domain-containing protein [Candidatus Weimeria bifida]RRF97136.1 MAG: EAL domain-containing protein [Lachnospiraceae bacterium]
MIFFWEVGYMYKWSFDFEVISLLMTVLLLIDIKASKLLPSKSTRLFLHTIGTQIALIASDFIASLLDNYAKGKFIGFQIFINTVYFALIFFFMASLHIFLRFFSFEKRRLFFKLKPYDFIPCAIANVFLIANLFTNVVFKIDSAGFFRGRLYYYIIYPYMIVELAICAITIARGRNYIIGKVRAGIYLSLAMITCVSAYQVYFKPGRLIMNLGFSSGLVIMYVVFVSTEDNKETKTSTFNPNGFYKYMRERIMSGSPFKVFFIKIQNYSSVLATYGRENTDELLRQIGVDLKKKEQRTFYLHAGLFAIVPENQSYYMIDEVLVNDVTSKERSLDDAQVDLSYRIVTCDESARFYSPQEMLESVSDAVDDPKCDKPQFSPISSDDIAKTIRKSEFYKSIFNALENGGVRVYYQPIFDNSLGRISSAEALVRIYDKKLGLIFPDQFIPLFEKNGAILKMGLIVFAKVCSFIRDNDMAALGLN